MQKKEQRAIQKSKFSQIQDRIVKEKIISDILIRQISNANKIIAYSAISSEINLDIVLSKIPKDKKIYFPNIKEDRLEFILPISWKKGKFSISEPVGDETITPDLADVCIIPGLGYNIRGYRLGRGGGYYDREFEKISPNKIIGVSFHELFPVKFDEKKYDIRLGRLITEKGVIFFEN